MNKQASKASRCTYFALPPPVDTDEYLFETGDDVRGSPSLHVYSYCEHFLCTPHTNNMGNSQSEKCKGNGVMGSVCKTVVKAPIAAANRGLCAPVDAAFAMACDLAFGGPEDPIGDIACATATATAGAACEIGVEKAEEYASEGKSYNPSTLAKEICAEKFCNS